MKFDQTSADTSLGGGWVGRRGKKLDFGDLDLIFKVTLPFGSLNFIGKKTQINLVYKTQQNLCTHCLLIQCNTGTVKLKCL